MPWLSRRNSAEQGIEPVNDDSKCSDKHALSSMVNFIPAQIDGLCGTMPAYHRQAASLLLWGDVWVLIQNLSCLPTMAKATCSTTVLRNLLKNPMDARDTLVQACLAIIQIWVLVVAIPAFITLPGLLFAGFVNAAWLLTLAMTWPLSGSRILIHEQEKATMTDEFSDERWIYVNGMMCSNRSLRDQCTRLSSIFGRPVTGIYNCTSGLILDHLTLLLQRCVSLPTPCTLAISSQIRDACLTNSVRKVILIGHSTGALHISIALDQLHASLPVEVLSKLEIYTFGSAAVHLSNPRLVMDHLGAGALNYMRPDGNITSPVKATLASLGRRVEDQERVIPHVEHYALASDIFARCGVLHNTRNVLHNRFCGRVFVLDEKAMRRPNGSVVSTAAGGFMLNEHYLDLLFPTDTHHHIDFLNQVVEVDRETAEKREFTAQGVALPQKSISRHSSENRSRNQSDSPSVSPKSENIASWETTVGVNGVGKARVAAKECEGKTVKQLSRLWRYAHGGRPVAEGVTVVNGVGKGMGRHGASGSGLGMVQ